MDADVAIVGAGIAGALIASRLAAAGVKVVILEAGPRVQRGDAVTQFMNAAIKVPECAYPNTAYAPHPHSDDLDRRINRYLISMLIRTICVVLVVVIDSPVRWVFAVGGCGRAKRTVMSSERGRSRFTRRSMTFSGPD